MSFPRHGEVSERFKEHAWKACVGETQPWVQIPPSPPLFPVCLQLVDGLTFSVYLRCTFRFEESHGILRPTAAHIRFCLLLAFTNPRTVMALGNLDALMPKQDSDALQRN